MKIRCDYVTNSSSSSFVIAKHKNCSEKEVKECLYGLRNQIESLLHDYNGNLYCDLQSEIKNAYESDKIDVAVNIMIDEITSELLNPYSSLTLNEWDVYGSRGSSEDGYLFESALYDFGHMINTERLKVKEYD